MLKYYSVLISILIISSTVIYINNEADAKDDENEILLPNDSSSSFTEHPHDDSDDDDDDVISISAGQDHSCAVYSNGTAFCWGKSPGLGFIEETNAYDTDTRINNTGFYRPTYVFHPEQVPMNAIQTGKRFSCGLRDNGSVMCWGDDNYGELGNDDSTAAATTSKYPSYVHLPEYRYATQISSQWYYTCAVMDNGSAMCWGKNDLFSGMSSRVPEYVILPEDRTVIQIATGRSHVCAILDNQSTTCWGDNRHGANGDGTTEDSVEPSTYVEFPEERFAIDIAVGFENSCAIMDNGSVMCWGRNYSRALGSQIIAPQGTGLDPALTPIYSALPEGETAVRITGYGDKFCVILNSGDLHCWGDYYPSQWNSNTQMPGGLKVSQVNLGSGHGCVILENGSSVCFGEGSWGERGDGILHSNLADPNYILTPECALPSACPASDQAHPPNAYDDDGDGFTRTYEQYCGTDDQDETSFPIDLDGDGICDYRDSNVSVTETESSSESSSGNNWKGGDDPLLSSNSSSNSTNIPWVGASETVVIFILAIVYIGIARRDLN
ncbi:MAG: hypothetical protein QF807_03640 [Candidatus Thalassarchaeaceae archaeon]|nr:hypothetical protein [Candidatus Thalassarchaeaceae archaeon]